MRLELDKTPKRREFYAVAIAALLAALGAGAWAFGVLRDDIRGAELRAERAADRIEGRLERIALPTPPAIYTESPAE